MPNFKDHFGQNLFSTITKCLPEKTVKSFKLKIETFREGSRNHLIITRPNCALDWSTILCLYVPGFQRQVLKYVPKCKWIPQTKFQYIYTCNVNFVGTFVLLWIPQQASIASGSGFCNCKWNPQNVSGIRKCKWNPQM